MLEKKEVEKILKDTEALLEGHFLLTSGRHANKYVQCAKVLQNPKYTEMLAKSLAESFKEDEVDIVIGPAMGGMIIGYELAKQLNAKSIFTERVDGKMTLRRGFEIPKGARVVIAEDVITTGGSVQEVLDIANANGAEIVGVTVLIDRTGGKIDFKSKLVSAYSAEIESHEAENCPICKQGDLPLVKPGSRQLPV